MVGEKSLNCDVCKESGSLHQECGVRPSTRKLDFPSDYKIAASNIDANNINLIEYKLVAMV